MEDNKNVNNNESMNENKNEIIVDGVKDNPPKKEFNVRLFITIMICVTVAIVSISCIVRAGMLGAKIGKGIGQMIRELASGGIEIEGVIDDDDVSENGTEVNSDLSEFTKIKVNLDMSNIDIVEGEKFSYSYEGLGALQPEIEIKDDTLIIGQDNDSEFSISSLFGKIGSQIVITIPQGKVIEKATISDDLGNLKIADVDFNNIEIKTDLGNVIVKDSKVSDYAEFTTSLGNITVSDCEFKTIDMQVDLGNITFKSDFDEMIAKSDQGNITISGKGNSIEAESDLGNINIDTNGSSATLDLESDLGNIIVDGKKMNNKYYSK